MVERIGKYRILERVGRGGMGTVYKAHDPVLDRLVALKVISSESDVTDELKARFYREAQACAKLSHPNVITVYDLGEDQGQLFIVMEFLEGEELKGLIARRAPLSLEDKLAVMVQVCDGLHYAHQKGIIHRDVKPGNIFVLQNGQAKILDFGIARIATTDPGLTRTGLIMGTLRYMAPEQARGRVDHRSDMFSAAAVFYELLAYRAAFDAEDPMETLERLRVENPPPLTQLDPSIPPALAAIVERALRKDPAQRYRDLAEMRNALDGVRRGLTDEAERLEARVRALAAEVRALEAALTRSLGQPLEDETVPMVIDRRRLAELHALDRDLAAQLERVRGRLRQVEALEPVVARAAECLRAGDARAAIPELERAVREVPEHARAAALLQQARRAAGVSPAIPAAPARAEPVLAATPPAAERQPVDAEALRVAAPAAPGAATGRAGGIAAALWRRTPVRGETPTARVRIPRVLSLGLSASAVVGVVALVVYGLRPALTPGPPPATPAAPAGVAVTAPPPEATARPVPPAPPGRQAAEELREKTRAAREAAMKAEAEQLAPKLWAPAAAKEREAEAALGRREFTRAETGYREAVAAYDRAAAEARRLAVLAGREGETRRQEERAAEARRAAEIVDAAQNAAAPWTRALGLERDAQGAARRQELDKAQGLWRDAEAAYRQAETEASARLAAASASERERLAALKRDLAAAEQVGAAAATARRAAEQAGAARHAAKSFASARDREKDGQSALERQDHALAQRRFREAEEEYLRAEQEARAGEAARVAALKADLDRGRAASSASRDQALKIGADRLAKDVFDGARAKESEAATLETQQSGAAAAQAYQEAAQRYGEALRRAQVAREAKAEADQARARMLAVKDRARPETPEYKGAVAEEVRADATYERLGFKEAAGYYRTAQRLFAKAAGGAEPASGDARAEIRTLLDTYKQAIEGKDVVLFRRIRPTLPETEVRRSFEESKSHRVDLTVRSIDVTGDEAEARGRRTDVVVTREGQTFRNEAAFLFKLRRTPAGWVIDAAD